jgi:protein-S-isoprenylcysteine O-methyltransferase Ste14
MLFSVSTLLGTLSLLKRDPGLVDNRLKGGTGAERDKSQKIILMLASIFACGLIVVSGIERHFHALILPSPFVLVADALIVTGFLIVFLVLRENSYASSIIEVKAGQHVTRRGPTAINGQWLIQCRW